MIGALAGSGLELRAHPVVTTTWREWVAEHPETTVLSLETGHRRDYSEGVAYRDYFANDRLMFGVPRTDGRLKNKDEVVTLLLPPAGGAGGSDRHALAVGTEFLERNPVHHVSFAGHELVILTSREGANRVYDAGRNRYARAADGRLEDQQGRAWRVTEEALVLQSPEAESRPRVPARRTFWFAWFAQFPETDLIR